MFLNRADELEALESRWSRGLGEFFIVWGRRRVGKTELLSHFLEGKRGFHFEATEGLEPDHLADISRLIAEETGSRLLAEQPLTSWPAVLAALEEYAKQGPAIVILDEFQWIARATNDIGSQLNRWWRTAGKDLPIFLILSGSEVSFFEREVLTGTMFGRRTGQQQLAPFDYRAAGLFFPGWSSEDRIRAYAVCGGMPYYLEQFDPDLALADNVLRTMLRRDGVLHEEAKLLLHEELPDPARYFSILRAIENGATKHNEIQQRTGIAKATLGESLVLLRELQLVRRRAPVTVANPDRTKQTSYEITDGYLRFYFRFMLPFESRLQSNAAAERHLNETVLPNLDRFVSKPTFEEICQTYVQREENAAAAGAWWGSVRTGRSSEMREVDVVAIGGGGEALAIGSCKWSSDQVGLGEENLLTQLQPHIPKTTAETRHYFFSLAGFGDDLLALSQATPDRYRLVAADDLFSNGAGEPA